MNTQKVWLVTGASKGLGLSLVKQLLQRDFRVAATSRDLAALVAAVGPESDDFLPLAVNLLDEASVESAVQQVISHFGALDVVVNNAGYGQIGTLEELSDDEARRNFDVNVFGVLNVIRQAMPHLRAQRSGHIFNISSIGGYSANYAGWGIYCATKFAVAALTEALAAEAKSFGIGATVVYPGYFRTNFLSKNSIGTPQNPIADYGDARASQALHQNDLDGQQAGDPEKAVAVLIEIAAQTDPPLHLFLGQDAYDGAHAKIASVEQDLEKWKELTSSTAFDV